MPPAHSINWLAALIRALRLSKKIFFSTSLRSRPIEVSDQPNEFWTQPWPKILHQWSGLAMHRLWSNCMAGIWNSSEPLKAVFNYVSTFKKIWVAWPYKATSISVPLIRCKNEALKNIALQKHHQVLQRSENRQVTGYAIPIFPHRLLSE